MNVRLAWSCRVKPAHGEEETRGRFDFSVTLVRTEGEGRRTEDGGGKIGEDEDGEEDYVWGNRST